MDNFEVAAHIHAILHFPNDEVSQAQLSNMLYLEKCHAENSAMGAYQQSSLSSLVSAALGKRVGVIGVTGLTLLQLHAMKLKGVSAPTKYAAAKASAENIKYLQSHNSRGYSFWTLEKGDAELTVRGNRAASSRKDITDRFTENSSVAHLAAASLLFHESIYQVPFPQSMTIQVWRYLKTALELERAVMKSAPEYFPNRWSLDDALPDEVELLDPFDVSSELAKCLGINSLWKNKDNLGGI